MRACKCIENYELIEFIHEKFEAKYLRMLCKCLINLCLVLNNPFTCTEMHSTAATRRHRRCRVCIFGLHKDNARGKKGSFGSVRFESAFDSNLPCVVIVSFV